MGPEVQTQQFAVPPERQVLRPLGLKVQRLPDGETAVTFLVTPAKFVIVELPDEAKNLLVQELIGGIVPVTAAEMPR